MTKKLIALILATFCLLVACKKNNPEENNQIYTVSLRQNVSHLYYNGTIRPIREELIISPSSGIVKGVNFHYGDYVRPGQLLLSMHSPEMESEFRETISNYLRAKQSYLNSKKSMEGTNYLYKEKIISEQEYFNEQSQYQNNVLTFIEGSNKLKQLLAYLPSSQKMIIDLSLSEMDQVKKLLQQQFEDLAITAKSPGIVLFPEQSNGDNFKEIQVGQEVKKNDVLLVIGDLSGVSVTAYVPEVDINQLKANMKVIISFTAQPELELHGKIISVARQAKSTENAGFSTFPVVVQADHLSSYQMQRLRVGMNAKINIIMEEAPALRIPIQAVTLKEGKSYVTLRDAKTEKTKEIEVQTGATSLNEVAIVKGLKPGDQVVLP